MKFLMLRGQVPQDRDPKEIIFNNIKDCDDVWTQLFFSMLYQEDYGELWYWGGTRENRFDFNFVERWIPNFRMYKTDFVPDVIFCRGGFEEYHPVLERFPKAIKIYYGAGRRFLPRLGFHDYDIILQDSPEQVKICKEKFPKALTTLFIKPAADNIFYPKNYMKEYDICFPANGAQAFKGHKFVYSTIPSDIKLLNLGNNPRGFKYPTNVTSYRVLRSQMAEHICKCKIGIVAVESDIDSCPRVIPEMLACGLPIVVLSGVRFWGDMYINSIVSSKLPLPTGEMSDKNSFWSTVRGILNNYNLYSPREYYEKHLSLEVAAMFIKERVNEVTVNC